MESMQIEKLSEDAWSDVRWIYAAGIATGI